MITEVARNFISESQIGLLKLSLSLRIYSAKVAMFHQMAQDEDFPTTDDCNTVVIVEGNHTCDFQTMINMIDNHKESVLKTNVNTFEVDHHYPASGENNNVS